MQDASCFAQPDHCCMLPCLLRTTIGRLQNIYCVQVKACLDSNVLGQQPGARPGAAGWSGRFARPALFLPAAARACMTLSQHMELVHKSTVVVRRHWLRIS